MAYSSVEVTMASGTGCFGELYRSEFIREEIVFFHLRFSKNDSLIVLERSIGMCFFILSRNYGRSFVFFGFIELLSEVGVAVSVLPSQFL